MPCQGDFPLRAPAFAAVIVVVTCSSASAQRVSVFDDVHSRLPPGARVHVTDTAGRETRGILADISTSSLQLDVDGRALTFQRDDVQQIDRLVRDSLKNGIVWGLVGGAGAAFLGIVAAGKSGAKLEDADIIVPLALIVGPAAGAAVGAAVDASRPAREPIYIRSVPGAAARSLNVRAPGVGIAVTMRF